MIYLDYQATTPIDPIARAAMEPWLGDNFANPHSAHRAGRAASAAIAAARDTINAQMPTGGSVIFTGGATEALNLAIKGVVPDPWQHGRRTIISIATEHAAVLDSLGWLERRGYHVVLLPVGADGLIDLAIARHAITDDCLLVAAMQVNNEIGVIQPIDALADIAHARGALMLCDAVQGFGRLPTPQQPDLIAISAHKIYGPKGAGALWRRGGIALSPLIHGGGQESGVRSGTLSPALIAGFGAAVDQCVARHDVDAALMESHWNMAQRLLPIGWQVHGSLDKRYHGNWNIGRPGVDAARLMADAREVLFSLGSACASGSGRPSHVLRAIGLSPSAAKGAIRLGWGRFTTAAELQHGLTMIFDLAEAQLG